MIPLCGKVERLKLQWFRAMRTCGLALLCLTLTPASNGQGPLTPPGGPEPTMKTLQQIEPRTPISALPFQILTPGAYYLVSNLTGRANAGGITIHADNVTLDLLGFALQGVPGSYTGVYCDGKQNVTVRNGAVTGWGAGGVRIYGVNVRIEDISASNNGLAGIEAESATITGCLCSSNQTHGIRATVGSLVRECQVAFNGYGGIFAGFDTDVSRCVVRRNYGVGILSESSSVSDSTSSFNNSHGIQAHSDARIVNNQCSGNGIGTNAAGIYVFASGSRIEGNHLARNQTGLHVNGSGNLVIRNSSAANTTNYMIPGGNLAGPIVATGSAMTNANPHANFSY